MVLRSVTAYRRAMQEWTRWFREKQSEFGTIEDFARASGIDTRSVSGYRAGRIPRMDARKAIARVLGSSGPLPGTPTQRVVTLEERLDRLEVRLDDAATREEVRVLRDLLQRLVDGQDDPGESV
jgi:transcriptional regulator with XRE-family HTH domain